MKRLGRTTTPSFSRISTSPRRPGPASTVLGLADEIRGFGLVKAAAVATYRARGGGALGGGRAKVGRIRASLRTGIGASYLL